MPQATTKEEKLVIKPEEKPVNKTDLKNTVPNASIKKGSAPYQPAMMKNPSTGVAGIVTKNDLEFKQFLASLNVKSQTFTVQPDRVTTITAEKGTELKINPADLVTSDGRTVTGEVKVVLKEYPGKLDMLKINSQTVSNGRLLVSGGSYYIELTANDVPLQLKEGKSLEAYFPGMKQEGMELFYGSKDENGTMNWVRPNRSQNQIADRQLRMSNDYEGLLNFPQEIGFYYLRRFRVLITPGELQYLVEVSRTNNQITRRKFDITDKTRKWITDQITTVQIAYPSYTSTDSLTGYYFYTDDCEIELDVNVLRKPNTELTIKELNLLKEKVEAYSRERRNWIEQQQFSNSVMKNPGLKKFGWINCDRFYDDTSIKKDFIVTLKYPGEAATFANVFMVFKNINSLVNGYYHSNLEYSFKNIPGQEEVALVAFTKVNGKIIAGKTPYFKLSNLKNYELKIQEIEPGQLDPLINSL